MWVLFHPQPWKGVHRSAPWGGRERNGAVAGGGFAGSRESGSEVRGCFSGACLLCLWRRGPPSGGMSTQGLSWWPGSCEGAQQTGAVSGISAGLAEVMAMVPQPAPFGHGSPFPLLSTHLFGMCFAFWEWGWNSLLLPKLGRKFSCLEISQAWSTLRVIRRVWALA